MAHSVTVDRGELHIAAGGHLTVAEDVQVGLYGTLSGGGTVITTNGRVIVGPGGHVSPSGSTAVLTTDDLVLDVLTTMEIDVSGNECGRLDVSGGLELGPASGLEIDWAPDGPASIFGGDYVVATYGTRTGTFHQIGGGRGDIGTKYVAGVDYVTDDQITVTLHDLLDGDIDLDGDVDFGDYLILESSFGSVGDWKDGDLDFDHDIDFGDYLILEAAFGNTVPAEAAATNIPEPGTLVMLLSALLGIGCYWRRRAACQE